jgi:hypothetical protein
MKNTDKIITNFDNAWLGLGDLHQLVLPKNPLIGRSKEDIENPDLHLLRILANPRYFGSTVKLLLGIELHPIQVAILQEFWNRPFPMFIASRGFGKLLRGSEVIRTQNGWIKMEDIKVGDKVYGSDGKLCNVVSKTSKQHNVSMYRISLRDGRTIECCEDHLWKVYEKNNIKILSTKNISENYFYNRKGNKSNGIEYKYALPINKVLSDEKKSDLLIHPYIIGVLLGDGCLTQKNITISSHDKEIINRVQQFLPEGYTITQYKDKKNYGIKRCDKSKPSFYKLLKQIGLYGTNSKTKFIPYEYQYASASQKLELIKGLMDTDGYSKKSVIEYYTISKSLNNDFLNIARSLGLHCKSSIKKAYYKRKRYHDCYRISIYTNQPIFSLSRKLKYLDHSISKQGASKYDKVFITNVEYIGKGDGYCITVDNTDHTYITKDYIVTHNSFSLALYAMLKCILVPGTKIVIVGSAFRQSKIIFEYMETMWRNSPIVRSVFNGNDDGPRRDVDRCTIRLGESWAVAIPMGDGSKIRGLRAHIIIADEFASISPDIYETVVSGFAAVSASPIQNVKEEAKKDAMRKAGLWNDELEAVQIKKGNQAIIAGTADYSFKHFAQYWNRYKAIINSKGDKHKLEEIFKGEIPDSFNWEDYSIVRIPYELIPKGFMDDKQVSRAKATIHTGIYNMEYAACFTEDSDGFFRRSLIESCVVNDTKPITINGNNILFDVSTKGNPNLQYVYGIDPASEKDNFSIIIIEIHPDHNRIVYCWTTNRNNFKDRQKTGLVNEYDFYGFCARKIRNLMKVFPATRIGMDAQGGGVAIEEALHDPGKLEEGEILIWPVIDPDKAKETDDQSGLHLLELVQFARADWTSQANHGLRKDLEDKVLLFPRFDQVSLALALDKEGKDIMNSDLSNLYDSESECILEIEELKNELTTIVMSQTSTGPNARDRWDTPEVKLPNGKKGKLRKDRYSALLIANMLARQISRTLQGITYEVIGNDLSKVEKKDGQMYKGPNWFTNEANANIYTGIYR